MDAPRKLTRIKTGDSLVFFYHEFDSEKISHICERDRLFQQLIDYQNSIDKWNSKEILSEDVEEKYNERRRKRRILEHLEENIKSIQLELIRLDSLISPFELLPDTTEKIQEQCLEM